MRKKNNLDLLAEKVRQMQQRKIAAAQSQRPKTFSEVQQKAKILKQGKKSPMTNEEAAPVISRRHRRQPAGPNVNKPQPVTEPTGFKDTISGTYLEYHPPVRSEYIKPVDILFPVPPWFLNESPVDVSIIVPMYKSRNYIEAQIRNWDMEDDGLTKEIIYVDDACPEQSAQAIVASWEKEKQHWINSYWVRDIQTVEKTFSRIGKVILLSNNAGFATACNIGAKHAKGKHLIFLNADTIVTQNWVKPMISLLSDEIGIVGNLQVKFNGTIDSAGSAWDETYRTFLHIGRDVYQGKRLSEPITLYNMPEDLLVPQERDMVTGCCLAINKTLFEQVGGFDIGYRIAYWEDSDLNEAVKAKGYKIYYQPESMIYHSCCHTNSGMHPYVADNTQRFYDKWHK